MTNDISEITRRDIFDELRLSKFDWGGRLSESEFLSRIFDLKNLPSNDHRCSTMLSDVILHREQFSDWNGSDWIYDDGRLDLLRCSDSKLLQFLSEMIHPIVRSDTKEVEQLLALFNKHLVNDNFRIAVKATISGKRIFSGIKISHSITAVTQDARKLADSLSSDHMADQISRMENSVNSDPGLAIGSAKEFVEFGMQRYFTRTKYRSNWERGSSKTC